ncbi:MAG TPA: aminotransferase class IV [Prolixibacteraceae bacterium]|jgi:branched-subunit amino acid aminotransferase/4-amino-4-deoxychorismate lyase|nr:MAG: branched-chain amino acid aminotransferase [Bacteroidetes bacterium ADurb.Bin123]HOY93416.1 aminotransferase class IV [Prolixibacteraceae bacterium]HPV18592.1 aminotransferase class IV [Prolixibacteraceae bacterium]
MDYILFNGKMVAAGDFNPAGHWLKPHFSLKEKMWFANGQIPFFPDHIRNIEEILALAGKTWPAEIPPQKELVRLSLRLINKNKAFMAGWLSLELLFSPRKSSFLATVERHPSRIFPFVQQGKTAILSPFPKFSGNPFSRHFFYAAHLWETEEFRRESDETAEPLFLNEKGMLTEAAGANVFLIKKNSFLTPSAGTGCIISTIRERILWSAGETGFLVAESDRITPEQMLDSDEIMLASEERGFLWISGIENRRFVKSNAMAIWKHVCKTCFPRVS